jgi:drug/metabolite transporter (DMT)-like permease
MLAARSRTELLAFLALLAMTAAWGSTFFLIKDVVTRIPVADLLVSRFCNCHPGARSHCSASA